MGWTRVVEKLKRSQRGGESGIALFMVIGAMTILSILVTEFTYVAQVNARMAYDGLDQVKALYLAKSGLKLSLLRLKAYQNVKSLTGGNSGGGVPGLPKSVLEKIWNFPFFYPIPTNLPGMTPLEKEQIEKFTKASGLDGKFSALIESESSKYNLNMLLAQYVPQPSPSASPSPNPGSPAWPAQPNPSPSPTFNAEEARKSLHDYLASLIVEKAESDEAFASEYRDFKLEDFMDNLIAWADRTYEKKTGTSSDAHFKGAPFYSLSELHFIEPMDDTLYDVFAPNLTVSRTSGINVNTIKENALKALVPGITDEEVKEFFKFRDTEDADNLFKKDQDFFNYLKANVASFGNSDQQLKQYQESLVKRNLHVVTDENEFKITVQAKVNQASRMIEAWVTLTKPTAQKSPSPNSNPADTQATDPTKAKPDAGLKITNMRIL